MNHHEEPLVWHPSGDRTERVKELMLSVEDFAALSGANSGFSPLRQREWMIFWKTDICEKDEFHTWFPALTLTEARRVWMAMEEHFFDRYIRFFARLAGVEQQWNLVSPLSRFAWRGRDG